MEKEAITLSDLIQQIEARSAHVGVIGLGYVGLPVTCMLANSGFSVTGVDIDTVRVATINASLSPFEGEEPGIADLITEGTATGRLRATSDATELSSAQIVIVCVDTPIERDTHLPSYRGLRAALNGLGPVLATGAIVIIESTIAPGTMSGVVIPELERAGGKQAGQDFYVGHCPERVTPGLLLHNLKTMSRSVGGQTPSVADAMVALYSTYVSGDLDPTDMLTAEIVKTAENAYRDVQIAFANELALICEQLGGDVYRVRELLNKSPGRNMLMPGAGVGGHCIPKDPWLLIANVRDQYTAQLIPAARAINNAMPRHMVDLVESALRTRGCVLQGSKVAILGYAFREETDDDRDTPSAYVVEELKRRGAITAIHDPYVPAYRQPLEDVIRGAQAAIIMVAHRPYRELDLAQMAQWLACPVLVDGRHAVDGQRARDAGLTYFGVGNRPQR